HWFCQQSSKRKARSIRASGIDAPRSRAPSSRRKSQPKRIKQEVSERGKAANGKQQRRLATTSLRPARLQDGTHIGPATAVEGRIRGGAGRALVHSPTVSLEGKPHPGNVATNIVQEALMR